MSHSAQSSGSFCSLLVIVFITLKLCGVIAWSWWWVLAPLWIPLACVLAVLAMCLLVGGIALAIEARETTRR